MKIIFQILLTALALVFLFIYVRPEYKKIQELRTQVSEYDKALDNARSLEQKRDEILTSYNSISKENKERLENLLPNIDNGSATSGMIALLLELDKIAIDNGLQITNVSFTPSVDTEENSDYVTSTFSFKTQATYNMFLTFLKSLESNLRIADIQNISFSIPKATREKPVVNTGLFEYSIELQTYWLKN